MWPPPGLEEDPNRVCLLNKILYSMKQSAKLWANDASKVLYLLNFVRSQYDNLLFFRREDRVYVITHVDDFKIIGFICKAIDQVKAQLISKFLIKDLGSVDFYLSIKVDRDRAKLIIWLTQTTTMDRIIKELEIKDYKIVKILIESGL